MVTSKMKKLFDPTISRKTKRQQPRMVGYYTTIEAAEKLGVDPATLRYRRDTADATAYWDMLGIECKDTLAHLLNTSHLRQDSYHYYEKKAFNKFVKLYNQRPKVKAARARRLRFPDKAAVTTFEIASNEQIAQLAKVLQTLHRVQGQLTVMVSV